MPAKVVARRRAENRPIRLAAPAGSPADIAAAPAGKKLGTFAGVAYTGAVMEPGGWYGRIVCDLDGIKVPSQHRPVLRAHDHEQIVGHTESVKVKNPAGITIKGTFSGQPEHTAKVTGPASNGFQWQLSIGATPTRTEFLEAGEEAEVNGRTVVGPLTIARETELGEISFVALGADGDTSATVTATKRRLAAMFRDMLTAAFKSNPAIFAGKYTAEDIEKMDEKEAKAALSECMEDDEKAEAEDDEKAEAGDEEEEDEEETPKAKAKSGKQSGINAAKKHGTGIRAELARAMKAARAEAAAEARRVNEIKARCAKYGDTTRVKLDDGRTVVDLIPHAIEHGMTANEAERLALLASRPGAGVGSGPRLHFASGGPDLGAMDGDQAAAILECAVFQANRGFELLEDSFYARKTNDRDPIPARDAARIKAELKRRYTDQVQEQAHAMFRGRIGLGQLLTIVARGGGYTGRDTVTADNLGEVAAACMRINADGGSTISIGNVTSNVQNKFLLQGYLFTEQAWRDICAFRAVKDFKATKSINLFGDTEFQDLGTSGELSNATLSDQAFANQVSTSGRILTIPRTTLINDDIGALGQVPMVMGRGAGLKLNKVFWTKFMNPGNDEGGSTAFFAAVHTIAGQLANSNYSSGGSSTLSSAGLTAATILFDNQVDPKGNPLGIDAELLVYPPDLETAAWELMNSQFIIQSAGATTKQPSENRWKGRFKPVKSRYLNKSAYTGYSAAAWYLLANPSILPVIEMAFLNGQETPTVQTAGPDFQFNILGITTRAFFDIGCNVQNFRGGVKSAGS